MTRQDIIKDLREQAARQRTVEAMRYEIEGTTHPRMLVLADLMEAAARELEAAK
jgi:hypothetical protein